MLKNTTTEEEEVSAFTRIKKKKKKENLQVWEKRKERLRHQVLEEIFGQEWGTKVVEHSQKKVLTATSRGKGKGATREKGREEKQWPRPNREIRNGGASKFFRRKREMMA